MQATKNRTTEQIRRRHPGLLAALGVLSLTVTACADEGWLLSSLKPHPTPSHPPSTDEGSGGKDAGGKGTGGQAPATGGQSGTGGAPTETACFDGAIGHPVSCLDVADAKDRAGAECEKRGLALTAFGPASCVVGQVIEDIRYSCCPKADPPPSPPPPTPPPANSCVLRQQGGDTSCKPTAIWEKYAGQDCSDRGLGLADPSYVESCGADLYRYVAYKCCTLDGAPLPTDDPPGPFDGPLVPGPARYAQYKCCLTPSKCEVVEVGGEALCKDAATWEAEATSSCNGKGGTLYGLGLYVACSL